MLDLLSVTCMFSLAGADLPLYDFRNLIYSTSITFLLNSVISYRLRFSPTIAHMSIHFSRGTGCNDACVL